MSPAQEKEVCDALLNIGWLDDYHALHVASVIAIRAKLACSMDEAKEILRDLRTRNLIDVTITPGGELDARQSMPIAKWRWIQPTANT